MSKSVEDIQKILRNGVPGYLSPSQASNLVLQLIIESTDPIESEALKFLSRFFTPQDYDELIEERSVLSKCGYPLCTLSLRNMRGQLRNPSNRTLLPWQHHFCQLQCYQASQFYREQLDKEPLVARKDVAWVPHGELHWENDILILHEIKVIATLSKKTVAETVRMMVKNQKLEEKLREMDIEDNNGISDIVSTSRLRIKERY